LSSELYVLFELAILLRLFAAFTAAARRFAAPLLFAVLSRRNVFIDSRARFRELFLLRLRGCLAPDCSPALE